MEILTKDGIKKIYYKATFYEHTITKKEKDSNNNEVIIKHKIKVLYNKEGELKGYLLSSVNMLGGEDMSVLYRTLESITPRTRKECIKINGEIKKIKTTTLKPSAKSRAKRGTTMLYLPNDWVDLLGIDENNTEVIAKMQGDALIIRNKYR